MDEVSDALSDLFFNYPHENDPCDEAGALVAAKEFLALAGPALRESPTPEALAANFMERL